MYEPYHPQFIKESRVVSRGDYYGRRRVDISPAGYSSTNVAWGIYQVIWFVVSVIEILLFLRFVLSALGANAQSSFVSWTYDITGALVAPFSGIVGPTLFGPGVLEWTTLIAAIVYYIIASLVTRLIGGVRPIVVPPEETV